MTEREVDGMQQGKGQSAYMKIFLEIADDIANGIVNGGSDRNIGTGNSATGTGTDGDKSICEKRSTACNDRFDSAGDIKERLAETKMDQSERSRWLFYLCFPMQRGRRYPQFETCLYDYFSRKNFIYQ